MTHDSKFPHIAHCFGPEISSLLVYSFILGRMGWPIGPRDRDCQNVVSGSVFTSGETLSNMGCAQSSSTIKSVCVETDLAIHGDLS